MIVLGQQKVWDLARGTTQRGEDGVPGGDREGKRRFVRRKAGREKVAQKKRTGEQGGWGERRP